MKDKLIEKFAVKKENDLDIGHCMCKDPGQAGVPHVPDIISHHFYSALYWRY